ncbi:MAG: hypothetical protein A2X49_15390 [Lentisphaerae bacterium GWF2_52_8]|nr:MAG: hypothetical protein A2X49_15390 [Lentisphaerae bacterium GWF2_52_8]
MNGEKESLPECEARRSETRRLIDEALKLDEKNPVAPHSEEGRQELALWFDVLKKVETRINVICNDYYDMKHPKHHLWLAHNQYLLDAVKPGERVLDIGCGGSYYQQLIAEKASELIGVDCREDQLAIARRNNTKSNVHYYLMDINKELPPGDFDLAICSHVLEHLDDPVSVLRKIRKRVKRLVVKVPLVDSNWMKLVKKDIGLFYYDDADHRIEYTEELLREQLIAAGWRIVEMIRGMDLRATALVD